MHSRRDFVYTLAATPLAGALAVTAAAAPESAKGEIRNRQSGMAYRRLGRTNLLISEVVMGGNTIAPDNYEHVLSALDRGLNYLDTAAAYGRGRSEEGYARVIKARGRDRFFLNTKISPWDINRNEVYHKIFESLSASEQKKLRSAALDDIAKRKVDDPDYLVNYFSGQRVELDASALANVMEKTYGRQVDRGRNYRQIILDSLDASLKRLGTDHVDLMMCPHGASTPYELLNYPEIFDAFEALKKAGKVRFLGVSAHTDPAGILNAAVDAKVYSAAMVAYNVVNGARVRAAIDRAKKNDVGVIAMKVARPVHTGRTPAAPPERVRLIEQAVPGPLKAPQKAYVWALRNPNLTAVISEMITRQHVDDNLALAGRKA